MTDVRRTLPAVGTLLELEGVRRLMDQAPRALVTDVVRSVIDDVRQGGPPPADDAAWVAAIAAHLAARRQLSLRPVINATGVVLHTNLGRAPLAATAVEAMRAIGEGYSNLEYDLGAGRRGARHVHCAALLAELTGAEDALVVNNCAAALVLALNTTADGREAVISRGELVEIGGSFRVPDIMAKSGARLVEVGTTNRTHADDYRHALSSRTGALVSVHRSNFTLEGFVASVALSDLVDLAAEGRVPLLHDFGSGLMVDLSPWGLTGEPTARDAIRAGASLVLMSGDKLLGGPQSGIIVGQAALVDALRHNPLARAVRVDKFTLASLEATLMLYRDPAAAVTQVPVLRMLTASPESVAARAAVVAASLNERGTTARAERSEASVGGGAFPAARIASAAVVLGEGQASRVEAKLRSARTPIIGRINDGAVWLDLRSVPPGLDDSLAMLVAESLG